MMYRIVLLALLLLPLQASAYSMNTQAAQAIVVDDSTGTILLAKNADVRMHPSSMSKLMTVYIILKELKEGKRKLTDTFLVSEKAWKTQGSKTFVELGNRIALDQLLQGIIVQSGNDACVVMAEGLAGSEEAFAALMNTTAQELGLADSHFANATGLPDERHLMSVRDLASLAKHIIDDFPEYYHFFSQTEFTYHGITQQNRNPLLSRGLNVDGLKTGHTDEGGYGVVASGKSPDGRRIILVVNGLPDDKGRAEESEKLMLFAYRDFENVTILKANDVVERIPVWMGAKNHVALVVPHDVLLTLPKARVGADTKVTLVYNAPVQAPIKAGAPLAHLLISVSGMPTASVPLVAETDIPKRGFFGRIWPNLNYLLHDHKP